FFNYPQDFKEKPIAPGVVLQLVWGERIMLSRVTFQPNSTVPDHSHPHEQTGIVLEGEITLTIGSDSRLCKKGDAFTIPDNVRHSVVVGKKPAVVLDTFNPTREDYK
ncbi:cupin domain-containing protein, partial [Chloroflexota bacterium]